MMETISLMAAVTLIGKSRRTLWRRLADGSLPRAPDDSHGRTMLPLQSVAAESCLPLAGADWKLVQAADAGSASAQNELGHRFLAAAEFGGARYWFEQAAKRRHADSMQWLAWLSLAGRDGAPDEQAAMVWLSRAAAAGHVIAQEQMAGLRPS
jgi:TPR repeat protein